MDDCTRSLGSSSSAYEYRISALFAILVGGGLGFFGRYFVQGRFSTIIFFFQTFAAGVVVATGFVHVLPDAVASLTNPCLGFSNTFPWANVFALLGALLTFVVEQILRDVIVSRMGPNDHSAHTAGVVDVDTKDIEAKDVEEDDTMEKKALLNYRVAAYTLEAGVIFHSIFVGITLGTSHDTHYVQGLAIALIFHQTFEGIALGGAISQAEFPPSKALTLGLAFALTTPIGIALGMGLGNTYNENSKEALIAEGSFNSISAGILIYNGLVDLIIPAFETHGLAQQPFYYLGFVFLLLGAGLMSLLAKWA